MSILCPACGGQTRVVQTDAAPTGRVSRVRECADCDRSVTTHETIPGTARPVLGGPSPSPRNGVHRSVEFIAGQLNERGITMPELGGAVGIRRESISRWVRGVTTPNVFDIEYTLNALGYTLNVVKNEDHHGNS